MNLLRVIAFQLWIHPLFYSLPSVSSLSPRSSTHLLTLPRASCFLADHFECFLSHTFGWSLPSYFGSFSCISHCHFELPSVPSCWIVDFIQVSTASLGPLLLDCWFSLGFLPVSAAIFHWFHCWATQVTFKAFPAYFLPIIPDFWTFGNQVFWILGDLFYFGIWNLEFGFHFLGIFDFFGFSGLNFRIVSLNFRCFLSDFRGFCSWFCGLLTLTNTFERSDPLVSANKLWWHLKSPNHQFTGRCDLEKNSRSTGVGQQALVTLEIAWLTEKSGKCDLEKEEGFLPLSKPITQGRRFFDDGYWHAKTVSVRKFYPCVSGIQSCALSG